MSVKQSLIRMLNSRRSSSRFLFGKTRNHQSYLTFGLIADVQYADLDDGKNYVQTRTRYYRGALESLKRTISKWKTPQHNIAFVLQLGDLIDGVNQRLKASKTALQTALAPFGELSCPTYHMVGNHELYNLTRKQCYTSELNSGLLLPTTKGVEGALYYSVEVHPCLKLVVIDSYDISVLGFKDCLDHPHYLEAVDILEQNNPNSAKNSAAGLEGTARRFVAYNGGIGKQQLHWLDAELTEADAKKQNVLICGHVQLNPTINGRQDTGICLTWNYTEVLQVIHSHSCVVGCLMGHDHGGSHRVDEAGVHHLVLKGVIERRPDRDASAIGHLFNRTLEIRGGGVMRSVSMPLRYSCMGEVNTRMRAVDV